MTLYRATPADLLVLNLDNVLVGDFEYVPHRMAIGKAWGNHFQIVVRGIQVDDAAMAAAARAVREHGFVNYYGLQRFSGSATRNWNVGRALLQRDYPGVVQVWEAVKTDPRHARAHDAHATAREETTG